MAGNVDNLPVVPAEPFPEFKEYGGCVVLHHWMADGLTSHFDWLCESAAITEGDGGPDDRSLIAFRAPRSPSELRPGESMRLERAPDHRRLYLHYEGPIGGDRGDMSRVASGLVTKVASGPGSVKLDIAWNDPHIGSFDTGICRVLQVARQGKAGWIVRCEK